MIIPLLFAEMIGGAATVGCAANAFRFGISAVWYNWSVTIGCLIMVALALVTFYRTVGSQLGVMSIPEAFEVMFDRKTRVAMMLIIVVVYCIFYAVQPLAAAAILAPMFGVNTTAMVWITSILFIIMAVTGGLRGLAWMNVVHSIVMYIGLFTVAYFAVDYIGGFSGLQAKLPATFFDLSQPNLYTVFAWIIGTSVAMFAAPTVAAVAFGANSIKTARMGVVVGGLLVVPFAVACAVIGMCAAGVLPGVPARTAMFAMASHLGPWLGGIAAMGVIAAITSSAPAFLLLASTTLTRDCYAVIKKDSTEKQQMLFSMAVMVVMGVLATIFALTIQSILTQILSAFQIRSIVGVVLVIALFWKRTSANAAFWTIVIAGGLAAFWHFAGKPFGIEPLWPSLGLGIPLLIVLSLLSKDKVNPGYVKYQEALKKEKAAEAEMKNVADI
jgi:SSS family solute:Na+ symporter